MQLGTAAYGIAAQTGAGLAVVLAGLVVFVGAAALMGRRFRRVEGVKVDGFTSQSVFAADASASLVYLGAFAAGTWAAFASLRLLVAVVTVAGGMAGCSASATGGTPTDPADHARGASPRVLGVFAVVGCLGFAALLLVG